MHAGGALLVLGLYLQGCASSSSSSGRASASPSDAPSASVPPNCCAALERAVLDELNRARSNPSRYADVLEADISYYRGTLFRRPSDDAALRTREGVDARREAIRVMRGTRALQPLKLSSAMSQAARDHVLDQAPRGLMNHKGTDGSMPWDRVHRYGDWQTKVSENMSFGPATGRDVVVALIIDDGIADRGHRKNILDPDIKVAGVSCGPHKTYRVMCDIVHAGGFTENRKTTASTGRN
jgi:hypothetical protein